MKHILNLDAVPPKSKIFIDSNIFIYHFTGVSEQCSTFLRRCEAKEVRAFSSVHVLLEVLHRLMLVEVVKKNLLKPPNLVKKLQTKPHLIKDLDDYFANTKKISGMGVEILPLDQKTFSDSQQSRKDHGLLVNDSLIISCMEANKIRKLASNDDAFLSIGTVEVYQPKDVLI
jgi:predicted nucleic acid-binding protein